jgi:hypothetical protein
VTSGPKSIFAIPAWTASRKYLDAVDRSLRIPRSNTSVRPDGCSSRNDFPGQIKGLLSSDREPYPAEKKGADWLVPDRKELKILTETVEAEIGKATESGGIGMFLCRECRMLE